MDYKAGFLVLTLLVGCFAFPKPEDDLSMFFDHTDVNARIVGGTPAAVGANPHMVALTNGILVRSLFCGGSLITERTVMTAAHCIAAVFSGGSLATTIRAAVGSHLWSQGTEVTIARNVTHPHYVSATIKNDIGLLITTTNVILSQLVQPIGLSFDYAGAGIPSRVTGWGRIVHQGPISPNLLELELDTIGGEDCRHRVAQAAIDFNTTAPAIEPHIEICTFHSPGHGTCNGDSGSALYRRDNGLQIGIVSWGFPCARGAPDMFVRVSAYKDWVLTNMV